jgi:hypothetical protein
MIHILKLLFVLWYHMFNIKMEKAPGYILKTLSCFFYSYLCILPFLFQLLCFWQLMLLHTGGGANNHVVLKKSNRWQCISFIFTYIEGTLNGVDMMFGTKM